MKKALVGALLLSLLWTSGLFAAVINVGSHELLPNTPGQEIQISATGGETVDGINFFIQIDDGSQNASDTPVFTNLDIISPPSIFAADNNGQYNNLEWDQIRLASTDTNSGVAADGVIGTVTIDTTGFFGGSWSLNMSNTLNGATNFSGVAADITDGNIWIAGTAAAPEPSSLVMLTGVLAMLLWGWRRQRSGR